MRRKAFISYSMKDSEQYVLTLLSNLLKEEGFFIDSSFDNIKASDSISYTVRKKISGSSLFIGVITKSGRNKYVMKEWKMARKLRIPSLLLVEDSIRMTTIDSKQHNVLVFNRNHPEIAIQQATNKIRKARGNSSNQESDNVLNWILGGLAIVALIMLLSDD